jgi:hypothetical protein
MVTDYQVRRLRKSSNTEKNQEIAAAKSGMDPKTARKYLGLNQLPSELIKVRLSGRQPLLGWAEACERVGLPGLYLHDMRRSAIRNLKRAGVQDVVAIKISGHKTRSVFDRYNIVDEGDLGDASERLEKYFSERKAERAAKLKRIK